MGTLLRGLALRCPVCGRASVAARPFRIRRRCPRCGAVFQREEGFFVGAIAINLVTTEAAVLLVYGACLLAGVQDFQLLLSALLAVALLFPVVFYHHSWSLWLSIDHIVESLPLSGEDARPGAKDNRKGSGGNGNGNGARG
jgi:uncharacterized protein (DUF983 family)